MTLRGAVFAQSHSLRRLPDAEHPFVNSPHLFADSWPGEILGDEIASTSADRYSIGIAGLDEVSQTGANFLRSRSSSQGCVGLETFRQITLRGHEYGLRMRPCFKHLHGKPFTQ